jgi:hypothetical protein
MLETTSSFLMSGCSLVVASLPPKEMYFLTYRLCCYYFSSRFPLSQSDLIALSSEIISALFTRAKESSSFPNELPYKCDSSLISDDLADLISESNSIASSTIPEETGLVTAGAVPCFLRDRFFLSLTS